MLALLLLAHRISMVTLHLCLSLTDSAPNKTHKLENKEK